MGTITREQFLFDLAWGAGAWAYDKLCGDKEEKLPVTREERQRTLLETYQTRQQELEDQLKEQYESQPNLDLPPHLQSRYQEFVDNLPRKTKRFISQQMPYVTLDNSQPVDYKFVFESTHDIEELRRCFKVSEKLEKKLSN